MPLPRRASAWPYWHGPLREDPRDAGAKHPTEGRYKILRDGTDPPEVYELSILTGIILMRSKIQQLSRVAAAFQNAAISLKIAHRLEW